MEKENRCFECRRAAGPDDEGGMVDKSCGATNAAPPEMLRLRSLSGQQQGLKGAL